MTGYARIAFAMGAAALLTATAYAQVITDGLVGYWPLDASSIDGDTVRDMWGSNDGVIVGNVTSETGMVGDAAGFDGTSGVEIAGSDGLSFIGAEELSVAAWVNAGSDDPVVGVVAGCCGSVVAQRDAEGWAMRYDGRNPGQEMEFIVHAGGWIGDGGFGAPKFEAGVWHHIGVTMGGGSLSYYLDGQFLVDTEVTGGIESVSSETEIGVAGDGGFVGLVDEVMIYNRALTADEMAQNFAAQGLTPVEPTGKLATRWAEVKLGR